MKYTKLFDPGLRAMPGTYVYQPEITLAVNVALATKRPLLISGPSGCGKSTLAKDVAEVLGWEFESEVITSRTEAADLLYRVDYLRQLRDTHTGLQPREAYVTPGVLWRAFDPSGSKTKTSTAPAHDLRDETTPLAASSNVVVLLDEIDKADPDVPNNLLEPFGDYRFSVSELPGVMVEALRKPLLVITTNNERRLPDAFIRRCVDLSISRPTAEILVQIGQEHFSSSPGPSAKLLQDVADAVVKTESYSTAEYLDTVRAILTLGIADNEEEISQLIGLTVRKTAKQVPQ